MPIVMHPESVLLESYVKPSWTASTAQVWFDRSFKNQTQHGYNMAVLGDHLTPDSHNATNGEGRE